MKWKKLAPSQLTCTPMGRRSFSGRYMPRERWASRMSLVCVWVTKSTGCHTATKPGVRVSPRFARKLGHVNQRPLASAPAPPWPS